MSQGFLSMRLCVPLDLRTGKVVLTLQQAQAEECLDSGCNQVKRVVQWTPGA